MPLIERYPKLKQQLQYAHEKIENAQNILLVSGNNPDGDSIGTMLALDTYGTVLRKNAFCFCASPVPESLSFLRCNSILSQPEQLPNTLDLVITFDLGHLSQTGLEEWLAERTLPIINIDHHQTNDYFGTLNIVYPGAASTTELIYNLFKTNGVRIGKETATALLTGLMTDTGNLSNPATSATAMAMAADLIKRGGNPKVILEHTFKNKSLESLKLWGEIINQLHHNERWGVTIAVITQQHLRSYKADDEWVEGLANFLTVLGEVNAILVLREIEPGRLKGSLRTTRNNINVESLASIMGGGGHKKSAGFTFTGSLAKNDGNWYIS